MSRIVPFTSALVLFVGIAGCGESKNEKPAEPTTMSAEDKKKMESGMEQQMKYHQKAQAQGQDQAQPAGEQK